MFRDLISAVQKALSERVRDPLLSGFTGFFVLWNWKPLSLLIFGSDGTFEDRLARVTDLYRFPKADLCGPAFPYEPCRLAWSEFLTSLGWTYGMPLGLTICYILFYPYIRKWFVVYQQQKETETINAKREKEREISLTPAESDRLRSDLEELQRKLEKTNRERYDLPLWKDVAREWAAEVYRIYPNDFHVAFVAARDRAKVQRGHWMVWDKKSEQIFYFKGRWDPGWRPCLVIRVLDEPLVLIQISGKVKLEIWGSQWGTLEDGQAYLLSNEEGEIRPGVMRQEMGQVMGEDILGEEPEMGPVYDHFVGIYNAKDKAIELGKPEN